MKDIVIYGAGDFGREVACLLLRINKVSPTWNLVGFIDDVKEAGFRNEYGTVLGGIDALNSYKGRISVAMSIGSPAAIRAITGKITKTDIDYPNIIAPDVIYMDDNNFKMGRGNILCTGCLLSCNVRIGNFNIFNDFVSIGHDTKIGDCNSFMTAARISGNVSIGNGNFFGVNSCVLQRMAIGNNTVIAAGSAVMRKTKDNVTYMGVPASPWIIR